MIIIHPSIMSVDDGWVAIAIDPTHFSSTAAEQLTAIIWLPRNRLLASVGILGRRLKSE
jgi:hypothetical protein